MGYRVIWLFGPDLEANSFLCYMNNQSYIGYMYVGVETPISVFPTAIDCSTNGIWPDIFVGNNKIRVRFYDSKYSPGAFGIGNYTTPILSENRLLTAKNA